MSRCNISAQVNAHQALTSGKVVIVRAHRLSNPSRAKLMRIFSNIESLSKLKNVCVRHAKIKGNKMDDEALMGVSWRIGPSISARRALSQSLPLSLTKALSWLLSIAWVCSCVWGSLSLIARGCMVWKKFAAQETDLDVGRPAETWRIGPAYGRWWEEINQKACTFHECVFSLCLSD